MRFPEARMFSLIATWYQSIDYRTGLFYAIIDSVWVIGSLILLLTNWIPFTSGGKWAVSAVAVIVALFASLEFYGSSRVRTENR